MLRARLPLILFLAALTLPEMALAQGYAGLFAEDPDAPKQQQPATPAPANGNNTATQTSIPGSQLTSIPKVTTSEALKARAHIDGAMKQNTFTAPVIAKEGFVVRERVNGKLPQEVATDKIISNYMRLVDNATLTPEKRKQNAQLVYKQLQRYALGLNLTNSVPPETYKAMGLSNAYAAEEKEASTKSLNAVKQAMDKLKSYQ